MLGKRDNKDSIEKNEKNKTKSYERERFIIKCLHDENMCQC